jgi:hypothetical protein
VVLAAGQVTDGSIFSNLALIFLAPQVGYLYRISSTRLTISSGVAWAQLSITYVRRFSQAAIWPLATRLDGVEVSSIHLPSWDYIYLLLG